MDVVPDNLVIIKAVSIMVKFFKYFLRSRQHIQGLYTEWEEEEEEDDTEQVGIFLNKRNLYHFLNDSSPCYIGQ